MLLYNVGHMVSRMQSRAADTAFGATVNAILFRQRATRKDLSRVLGVTGSMVTRKLRGDVTWSLEDILKTSAWLGVPVADLLPTPTDKALSQFAPALLDPALIAIDQCPHGVSNPGPTD